MLNGKLNSFFTKNECDYEVHIGLNRGLFFTSSEWLLNRLGLIIRKRNQFAK